MVALFAVAFLGAVMQRDRDPGVMVYHDAGPIVNAEEVAALQAEMEGLRSEVDATIGEALALVEHYSGGDSVEVWKEKSDRLFESLQSVVPDEAIRTVYVHGNHMSDAARRLAEVLQERLQAHGLQVLEDDAGASLDLSAGAATLLDTLPPGEEPEGADSHRFFQTSKEIQALLRIVETPDGLEASWVLDPGSQE
ncbi:MAG: hypothetical protein KDB61_15150, partial [Planctomycetes bacterium]|nr:hypothetical protein [Planctomycetota bacterium]